METAARAAGLWSTVAAVLLALQPWDRTGLTAVRALSVNHHQTMTCEDVRLKCAYGAGCSLALHNYFSKCDRALLENSTTCPEQCLHALVTLTSTEDGKRMMDCTCRDNYCEEMKARVEVCRALVIETSKDETVVPCELASWICGVDRACANAMGYYQTYCKRMLEGLSCSERCLNSVEILRRQEKAAKLNRCRCDGKTAFECLMNKQNTVRLCYNGGGGGGGGGGNGAGGGGGRKNRRKHRPRMFDQDPDRAEVEMMLANPNYRPGDRFGGYRPTVPGAGGDKGGASSARGRPPGVLCAIAFAVTPLILVTAALRDAAPR